MPKLNRRGDKVKSLVYLNRDPTVTSPDHFHRLLRYVPASRSSQTSHQRAPRRHHHKRQRKTPPTTDSDDDDDDQEDDDDDDSTATSG
mmetsp:Transcript_19916/g.64145  ORF Transcript_19916/g.64145 Transcript_19916/m.64145 type:complete len:88 (+) Transcript_19916:431-694(+)